MRYFAVLAGLVAATSAAVLPRQVDASSPTFNISSIVFSSSPHSLYTSYNFNVTDGVDTVNCRNTTSTGPYISSVSTSCCNDDCSWTWTFNAMYYDVYGLNVTKYEAKDIKTSVLYLPGTYVVLEVDEFNPNGNYQYLNVSGKSFQPAYTTYPLA